MGSSAMAHQSVVFASRNGEDAPPGSGELRVLGTRTVDDQDFFPHALPIGTEITGYRIQRVLGQGGFGITYMGSNPITELTVAIKEVLPHGIAARSTDSRVVYDGRNRDTVKWALDRFEQSTRDLCRLEHPHIVKVINYVKANDTGYMIMDYVAGSTLGKWLQERQAPELAEFRRLMEPVLDAMAYVHANNLIHRDIAPDNIMIRPDGRPVLIDFGAMKLIEQKTTAVTGMSFRVMKRHFSPPEQSDDGVDLGRAADIYSLGAVFYTAFSGSLPVDAEERKQARLYQRPDPYVPLADAALTQLGQGQLATVDRALAFFPKDRPQSIEE